MRSAAADLRAIVLATHGVDAARRLDDALRSGVRVAELAAARRARFEQFAATPANVDVRLQESLDKAWKILGRVVAGKRIETQPRARGP